MENRGVIHKLKFKIAFSSNFVLLSVSIFSKQIEHDFASKKLQMVLAECPNEGDVSTFYGVLRVSKVLAILCLGEI